MIKSAKNSHADVVPLLEENLRSYRLLLRLAEETHDDILSGRGEGFAESIAKRRTIQAEIRARDVIIEQTRPHLTNTLAHQKITGLVNQCAATIAEIQEVDKKIRSLIQEESERLRGGIERMRRGRKSLRTYGKRTPSVPRFVDRRG